MTQDLLSHSVFQYLVAEGLSEAGRAEFTKLPPMGDLAKKLGVSRGKLREDLITAQAYGMVEMRPGDGTYVRPFDFYSAIQPLVLYSVKCDKWNFDRFYRLRARLEISFWEEAVHSLAQGDLDELERISEQADRKLEGVPVEIPHDEHRDFHLLIFSRLDNAFVRGLLKVYWDAYEAVGLHRYFELGYYERMWSSHRAMVEDIRLGQYREGQEILIRHFTLLESRLQDESARR